ncbi:MAG TPA: glycosyltransferase family 39 protein [Polyangiaceae bacterium]
MSEWARRWAVPFDAVTRRDGWFSIGIVVLALLLRVTVGLHFAGEPVWDGHYYHYGAVRLADGFGYSEDVLRNGVWTWKPWTHYPVGYSLWLSLWYRAFGSHLWVAPISNAVAGAFTVLAIHRLALPALGLWRARLAAVIVTLHPGLVLYTAVAMSEPLAACLLLAALLPLGIAKPRWLGYALSGLLLGASVLVRPTSLLALPLVWLFLHGSLRHKAIGVAAVGACCLATILPWTLRNCYRMDGCALVSTNAGWNLAIGALTETGRFRPLHAADGCPVVTGQVQQDRCWAERGLSVIRRDPLRWAKLAPKKLEQTFNHESFAVEYLREANPAAWPEARRVAWRESMTDAHRWIVACASFSVVTLMFGRGALQRGQRLRTIVQWALIAMLLVLVTMVFHSDEHPLHWLILAFIGLSILPLPGRPALGGLIGFSIGFVALTALSHVMFFGDDRYHLVVSPLLSLLAAAALRRDTAGQG